MKAIFITCVTELPIISTRIIFFSDTNNNDLTPLFGFIYYGVLVNNTNLVNLLELISYLVPHLCEQMMLHFFCSPRSNYHYTFR